MSLKLLTERQETLTIHNLVKAVYNIENLNNTGYKFINQCSGFIAHYDINGFKDHYTRQSLWNDILRYQSQNQWNNFRPGERDYDYMMQKKRIYNTIVSMIKGN